MQSNNVILSLEGVQCSVPFKHVHFSWKLSFQAKWCILNGLLLVVVRLFLYSYLFTYVWVQEDLVGEVTGQFGNWFPPFRYESKDQTQDGLGGKALCPGAGEMPG